jgi:hypothetical protein
MKVRVQTHTPVVSLIIMKLDRFWSVQLKNPDFLPVVAHILSALPHPTTNLDL